MFCTIGGDSWVRGWFEPTEERCLFGSFLMLKPTCVLSLFLQNIRLLYLLRHFHQIHITLTYNSTPMLPTLISTTHSGACSRNQGDHVYGLQWYKNSEVLILYLIRTHYCIRIKYYTGLLKYQTQSCIDLNTIPDLKTLSDFF